MKYQILFSTKNTKNIIDLSSAEIAKREVKVKEPITTAADDSLKYFVFILQRK